MRSEAGSRGAMCVHAESPRLKGQRPTVPRPFFLCLIYNTAESTARLGVGTKQREGKRHGKQPIFENSELTPGDYVLFVLADGLVLKKHTLTDTHAHTQRVPAVWACSAVWKHTGFARPPPAARSSLRPLQTPPSAGILMLTQHQAALRGCSVSGLFLD